MVLLKVTHGRLARHQWNQWPYKMLGPRSKGKGVGEKTKVMCVSAFTNAPHLPEHVTVGIV